MDDIYDNNNETEVLENVCEAPEKYDAAPEFQESTGSSPDAGTASPSESTGVPRTAKKKGNRGWIRVSALILACALAGGISGYFGSVAASKSAASQSESETVLQESSGQTIVNTTYVSSGSGKTASEVYTENVNSTVGITTSVHTNYFGYTTSSAASGSGFILTSDGYILTNYHVVEDASTIEVTLYDNRAFSADLIGYDEDNDIAVLKIDAKDLDAVVLGSSEDLSVGDTVVAIGNPLGELTFSLTQGVVSALDRKITLSSGITMDLIQTDCAINSGNSGGALFNMNGEVVGITNAKYSRSSSSTSASIENIGFAIPISRVKDIVEGIISRGYYATPYIGITVANVSSESIAYGLPEGAAVKSVVEDGPSDKAGIEANDIITAVDGNTIKTYTELTECIKTKSVGDKITLTVYRQGKSLDIEVTVGEKKQTTTEESESSDSEQTDSGTNNNNSSGQWSNGQQMPSFPFGGFSNGQNF